MATIAERIDLGFKVIDILSELPLKERFEVLDSLRDSLRDCCEDEEFVKDNRMLEFTQCVGNGKTEIELNKEDDEPAHGQEIEMEHRVWLDWDNQSSEDCDGTVFWDAGLEGYVCDKCNLYTGVK